MGSLLRHSPPLAVLVLCAVACSGEDAGRLSAAPSLMPAPAAPPAPVSPNAISILLGETVTVAVSKSDPPIATTWGMEPARRFSVAIPSSGILSVRVKSPGPGGLTLWMNSSPGWGTADEIVATARVQGGTTYEIAVSMHDAYSTSLTFELTTSLGPQ